jgi:hypothetical protein
LMPSLRSSWAVSKFLKLNSAKLLNIIRVKPIFAL